MEVPKTQETSINSSLVHHHAHPWTGAPQVAPGGQLDSPLSEQFFFGRSLQRLAGGTTADPGDLGPSRDGKWFLFYSILTYLNVEHGKSSALEDGYIYVSDFGVRAYNCIHTFSLTLHDIELSCPFLHISGKGK